MRLGKAKIYLVSKFIKEIGNSIQISDFLKDLIEKCLLFDY